MRLLDLSCLSVHMKRLGPQRTDFREIGVFCVGDIFLLSQQRIPCTYIAHSTTVRQEYVSSDKVPVIFCPILLKLTFP